MTKENDFIIAFFPCTHFCDANSLQYRLLIGVYDEGHCSCIIATYSLKTKRLLIRCANEHIPESKILKQLIEYAESEGLREHGDNN